MTPPKFVVHESDCPVLHPCTTVQHQNHACTCPGSSMVAVDPAKMVEALDYIAVAVEDRILAERPLAKGYAGEVRKRIETLLQPFRRESRP